MNELYQRLYKCIRNDINVLGIIQMIKLLRLRLRLEVRVYNGLKAYYT